MVKHLNLEDQDESHNQAKKQSVFINKQEYNKNII